MATGNLYKQDYKLSHVQENLEMVFYTVVCFFIPFLVGHPQWLVGTIVNSAIILAAFNLRGYKVLPVIIAPSLGVLVKGLIFGPFTVFLLYMIPFIWMGNFILLYVFKRFELNKLFTLGIGAFAKMAFLFVAAFVLVKAEIIPVMFLTAMGIVQFYTAMSGGIIAFGIQKIKKNMK